MTQTQTEISLERPILEETARVMLSYANIDKHSEANKRSWRPLLYLLITLALVCAISSTLGKSRRLLLVSGEEPAAFNKMDFQTGFSSKKRSALPQQVDEEYASVSDEVAALEDRVDILKRKSKHVQTVHVSVGHQGPPGPKGPRGKAGPKGPQGPAPSGAPTIKKCAVGLFFNGASCSPCTTGPCPSSMYRQACSATEDSRCVA